MRILRKPDCISWDDLAKCQQRAHESNKEMGVSMQCADYTADDLKNALNNAITLIALDKSDALAGMLSINFVEVKRWWHKGIAAYICYVAVDPMFKGRGIYRLLSKEAEEIIRSKNVNVVYLNTHVNNILAKRTYERDGFKAVRFSPGSGTDYYSIEMAKWLNGGEDMIKCKLMFLFTKLIIKLLYKPGKIRRF